MVYVALLNFLSKLRRYIRRPRTSEDSESRLEAEMTHWIRWKRTEKPGTQLGKETCDLSAGVTLQCCCNKDWHCYQKVLVFVLSQLLCPLSIYDISSKNLTLWPFPLQWSSLWHSICHINSLFCLTFQHRIEHHTIQVPSAVLIYYKYNNSLDLMEPHWRYSQS